MRVAGAVELDNAAIDALTKAAFTFKQAKAAAARVRR